MEDNKDVDKLWNKDDLDPKKSKTEYIQNLEDMLRLSDSRLCDMGKGMIDFDSLPNIYRADIKYNVFPCMGGSPTELIARYIREKMNGRIDVNKFLARYKGTDHKNQQNINLLLECIGTERMMSNQYYVVYHACLRLSYYNMQIATIFNSLINNTPINTLLFRTNKKDWIVNNDNTLRDATNIAKYIQRHVDKNIPYMFYDQELKPEELFTNKPMQTGGLDLYPWFKKIGIAVNLSLLGGATNVYESTFDYFDKGVTCTQKETMFGFLDQSIDNMLKVNNVDQEMSGKLKIIANKYKNIFRQLYTYLYEKSDSFNSKTVLMQIFIKKEVANKLLYICTPYGNPLPFQASSVLDDLQSNKIGRIEGLLQNIKQVMNDDKNVNYEPKELLGNTKAIIDKFSMINDPLMIQARFVCTDIDTINERGNVIINHVNQNMINDTYHMHIIYKAVLSMIIDCRILGLKLFAKYHKDGESICNIM